MKRETPKTNQEVRQSEPMKTGDLNKAVERIHQRYGNDLEAFFRDAKESLLKRNATLEKGQSCVL